MLVLVVQLVVRQTPDSKFPDAEKSKMPKFMPISDTNEPPPPPPPPEDGMLAPTDVMETVGESYVNVASLVPTNCDAVTTTAKDV
jgi:hypothetical protein